MRNLQARRRALRGRYRARSALRASSSPPGRIDGDEKGAIDELVVWLPAMFALELVSLGVCYAFIFACENI
jgi:hypothetical protein